jgi:hypothetical protein
MTPFRIRIEIAPGDHFDIEVKPFDQLTVADHIRLYESNDKDQGHSSLDLLKNRIIRMTGAPSRFIRHMKASEAEELMLVLDDQIKANDRTMSAMAKVNETLENWEKEHDGEAWTLADVQAIMEQHSLFRDRIEVDGKTFTAPLVEPSSFGKWIDLSAAMSIEGAKESESYVRACSIMMEGEDGPYPVQRDDETDAAYTMRCDAYTESRRSLFHDHARFVDVLGCAAFFFSKFERFAAICGHSMPSLQALMPRGPRPEAINLQHVGVPTQS